jgi:hypothetical protein
MPWAALASHLNQTTAWVWYKSTLVVFPSGSPETAAYHGALSPPNPG